ncbi:MAG: nickel-responsive transcriptional regulator NikR [Phycisphaerae bacterium]|nr:nickel-responsive transcriptional regulator NikR [Phycisphaerae bacterium]
MPQLVRFGVSMEGELLDSFDKIIARKGYANRSEAIRDLIRESLVEEEWQTGREKTCGALCLVYDHHSHDLSHKLMHAQHEAISEIISTLHVHLDHDNCFEIIVLRGEARDLQALADRLISTRGVKYGRLMVATSGTQLR